MTETVEAVFRIESARIIAGVARIVRDVGIAEELAQDALVAALEQWPESGVPDKPGAWLTATAKHRAIDLVRRKETYARKLAEVGRAPGGRRRRPEDLDDPDDIDDDLLRLIFTACHPVLPTEARIALTLRLLGGLTTGEIARAFLASEPTVAQRIVRAKRTLAKAGVPFEVPYGADRAARLSSVLEVIYLVFNEGYSATAGRRSGAPGPVRGRAPAGPRARGADARGARSARPRRAVGVPGFPYRGAHRALTASRCCSPTRTAARWNRMLIHRGVDALGRAGRGPGPYALQAAIAALPRAGGPLRGHRLGVDRHPLRPC